MQTYVVILSYKVPLERIMETVPEHRSYLDEFYEQGRILFSGIQSPPKGGVIIMKAKDEDEVRQLIEGDPFYQQGLADYETITFEVRRHQACLEQWINE